MLVGGAGLPRKADLPEDLNLLVDRHYAAISINGFRNEMAGLARRSIPEAEERHSNHRRRDRMRSRHQSRSVLRLSEAEARPTVAAMAT